MPAAPTSKTLLAYFSRPGENHFGGGYRTLEVGNTEVLATMIGQKLGCDVVRIEAAAPYPEGCDAAHDRNVAEQEAEARPALVGELPNLDGYDTVLLGSPVWNRRAPRLMFTFIEGLDLAGRTVIPFATHAGSGIADLEQEYRTALPDARLLPGLAVHGDHVAEAGDQVDEWLRTSGLIA